MSENVHEYQVKVEWTKEREGDLTVAGKPLIHVAAPPEFDGPEGVISPEDLFVAANAVCFMTTFVTFTKKMHFEYKGFSCEGVGTLERMEKGFQFTKILLKTTVTVDSEELRQKVERALELAHKYCLVANSMRCPTEHENQIVVE